MPQPIDYGAKLTGQAGAFDIGVLQVRTRDRGSVPGEDFTVMRSQHRFWRQSYVGALFTNRSDASAPDLPRASEASRGARQTAGVDFALATAQLLGKQVLEVSGFYLDTTKRPGSRGGAAFGARINMPNDPIYWHLAVREVQDGYDPAAGFVDRRGYRMIEPGMRYTVHTERGRYSQVSQAIFLRGKLQHDLQSRRADRNTAVRRAVDARRPAFERPRRVPPVTALRTAPARL